MNNLDFLLDDDDHFFDSSYEDEECDAESLASLENEEENQSAFVTEPEKILAEHHSYRHTWYLVKWENCPLVQSSWEIDTNLTKSEYKNLLDAWREEKVLQNQGQKDPFDLQAFTRLVDDTKKLEQGRRNLRRWKRQVKGIIAAITVSKVD